MDATSSDGFIRNLERDIYIYILYTLYIQYLYIYALYIYILIAQLHQNEQMFDILAGDQTCVDDW